ncbi:hypothetical protein LZ575_04445 [Antarcticibacterium sp. 1MA-6-2]|uniref:hypothetical protein n=1 Tax=Antarcticibacterium sp. 1MA-6-2 TaxID=2908210 RepID=UPI001F40AEAA|nr:hypothetical protein [Antarcticibacterium sp. 1MA-6-2]UJH91902.1 hypothetical protein LZ575_04445 [Antarcticibacterium sp. 1MA-6-2]
MKKHILKLFTLLITVTFLSACNGGEGEEAAGSGEGNTTEEAGHMPEKKRGTKKEKKAGWGKCISPSSSSTAWT